MDCASPWTNDCLRKVSASKDHKETIRAAPRASVGLSPAFHPRAREVAVPAEEPSGVADAILKALDPFYRGGRENFTRVRYDWHVFPDSNSRKLAKIMEPFLINVVERGDMYASQFAELYDYPNYSLSPEPTSPLTGRIIRQGDYGFPGGPRYY